MRNIIGEMVVAAHNIIQAQPALASTLPAIVPVFYVDPSKDESLADNIEFAAHSSGSDGEYWFRIAKPNDDSGGYDWVYPEVAEAHHAMQEEFQPEFGGGLVRDTVPNYLLPTGCVALMCTCRIQILQAPAITRQLASMLWSATNRLRRSR